MGKLFGEVFAIDNSLSIVNIDANYIQFTFGSGEGFAFDFSKVGMGVHGGPHIDILGEKLQHIFRSECRGMYRIDLFAQGFIEGMIY